MELKSSYLQPASSTLPSSTRRNSFHGVGAATAAGGGRGVGGGGNVFGPTFSDPLCSLNLKETSEFVRSSFPMATMARSSSNNGHGRGSSHHHEASSTTSSSSSSTASAQRRRADPPPPPQAVPATPGRPLQFFSSPAHHQLVAPRRQRSSGLGQRGGEEEKRAAAAVRRSVDALSDAHALALLAPPPAEVLLKDKFTDNEEPSKETFVFRSAYSEPAAAPAKGAAVAAGGEQRRDIGTEMTPLGSSCVTPLKSTSPARHNTPASRYGPLVPYAAGGGMDISELADCHLAKLDLGARFDAMLVNWSSKEEEEEEVSKSLRHFETTVGSGGGGGVPPCDKRGGGDCRWEDDDRAKSCIRYQREEAKIQAWVNLESAKAEAQSRKLEVKIQKMRSNLEEKLMRRMTTVHRRAEEWRATAQAQHLQQLRRAAADNTRRLKATSHHRHLPGSDAAACGCFPCSNNVVSGNLLNYY
ncbi:unnamed protein product [Urochloa decumbens]|uniref:Remorin C-terminal domain-containing protein n=1 Tax=Urochloa decumbens TaxID=240449 RepID=A0ABC9AJL4_9POAL